MKKYTPRTFKPKEETYYSSKEELQLSDKNEIQSFFYTLNGTKNFKINFCVPNLKFRVYDIFTIRSEIWIIISDRKKTPARGKGKNYILQVDFDENSLPSLDGFTLPNDEIKINIFNDDRFTTKWNKSLDNDKEPSENGKGGVIIETDFP